MLRRSLLPLALLLAGIVASVVLVKSRPPSPAVEVDEKVWNVAVIAAQTQRLNPTLTLYARVESPRFATLRAAINAEVIEVFAREGDEANSGDLLLRLDASDVQLLVAQREADLAELRAEFANEELRLETDRAALTHESKLLALARRAVERAQLLATRDLGSAAVLDEAEQDAARQSMNVDNRRFAIAGHSNRMATLNARLARAQSQHAMARLDLARTQIAAPFDARIASLSVAPGDRVRVGDALLEVFDPLEIELRAQVPNTVLESLRRSLHEGQAVTAAAMLGDTSVRAHLDRLGARIGHGRAGADALFRVEKETARALQPGRSVQLFVSLPAIDKVVPIPAEALYGVDRIYVLRDSRMRLIRVQRRGELTRADGTHRLLVQSEQLKPGTQIIATQLPSAVDGLKVRVAN